MRRTVMMMVAMAVLVALAAGVAVAAKGERIQCTSDPCTGTGGDDRVFERIGNGKNDSIFPLGGDDRVKASKFTNDRDVVDGGSGNDKINVNDGDTRDAASGGTGNDDVCIVDARAEADTDSCEDVRVR